MGADMENTMWGNFRSWLNAPFRAEMTALDWFLFVGLLIFIAAAWRIILSHIDVG